jgi:Tfp pilus assembly protein PilX
MAKTTSKHIARSKKSAARQHTHPRPNNKTGSGTAPRSGTKQAHAIAMLRSTEGASIPALMEAIGWQQHSVRGFLAGVVRKRLKLNLISAENDGVRIYRITSAPTDRTGKPQGARAKS